MKFSQKAFGDIAELRNGVNYVVADQGAAVRVVGVGDFQRRTEISNFESLSEIRLRSNLAPDDELQDGDLLFVRSNGNKSLIGRCMVIRNPPPGVTFSGFTIRARLNKSVVFPEYIALIFQAGALNRQMTLAGGGNGNISNLNQAMLADMPLDLPRLEAQKSIVNYISIWDTAIQKTEQLIAVKELRYRYELSRLINRNERVDQKNKPAVLGDFLVESRDPDTEQDSAKRLTVRLHLQGVDGRPVRGSESEGATTYFRRRAGQLIYGKQNIFRGAIGLIPPELDGYSSTQDLPAFDIKIGVDPQWLYFWLARKEFYTSLESLAAGSGSKRLHPEEFFKIKIVLPGLEHQKAIACYLNALREEITLLEKSAAALKLQKRGLMQKLLTGQWRLSFSESEEAIA